MNHIEEAEKLLIENLEPWQSAPDDKTIALAQVHALISIAESLKALTGATVTGMAPTVEQATGSDDPYREAWEHMDEEADEGEEEAPEYFIGSEIDQDKLSDLKATCHSCETGNTALGPDHAEWCDKYVPF